MDISYCCKCETLTTDIKIPQRHRTNCRDGWGRGLYVFECPFCGYENMATMMHCDKDEKEYVKGVIEMYYSVLNS